MLRSKIACDSFTYLSYIAYLPLIYMCVYVCMYVYVHVYMKMYVCMHACMRDVQISMQEWINFHQVKLYLQNWRVYLLLSLMHTCMN
jgi:hypothetical protein